VSRPLSRNQNNKRIPPARSQRNVSFKVEVKVGHTNTDDRARVAKVVEWDNGVITTDTWWVAQYIPEYHEGYWDHYRARKAAEGVYRAAVAIGGVK
jgi:hypothetical protein